MPTQSAGGFGRDRGLEVRMLLTLLLFGLLYVGLVFVLLAAGAGVIAMVIVVGALAAAQLLLSDRLALRAMSAQISSPQEAPGLHALVERLCVQASLPKPRVAIAQSSVPNALALGRSPRSAVVCVTVGLLRTLEPGELRAVIAHELAHVKNRDVMVMTPASFFASVAAMLTQSGLPFGRVGHDREGGRPAFAVVLAVSAAVHVISLFLMLALSRYREFAADRGSAIITGRASPLATALTRLDATIKGIPDRDLRAVRQLNAIFILPAQTRTALRPLLVTHPPVEQRIARLERLESQLQSAA
jgi:heat shock protein HtpX